MNKATGTTIQVRIDPNTKKKAQAKFRKRGLTMSAGVKMFLHEFVRNEEKFFPPVVLEEVDFGSLSPKTKKAYYKAKKTPKSKFVNI